MILQSASRKEVTRIAIGSGICACVQVLVFWLLSLLGIGTFIMGVNNIKIILNLPRAPAPFLPR